MRKTIFKKATDLLGLVLLCSFCGCAAAGLAPTPPVPGGTTPGATVFDQGSSTCSVSYEGVIWYQLPAGQFSPIDVKQAHCQNSLSTINAPPRPSWAIPHGQTQTRFVATSLQQAHFISGGMQSIEAAARQNKLAVSWMAVAINFVNGAGDLYSVYHKENGDDIEGSSSPRLIDYLTRNFPWYVPTVSVEGAGHERNIAGLLALNEHAFWGITWNSHGVDGTYDYGAPWGSYCADPTSYKRPQPNGRCSLLALEWTARDLTRAYISGDEDYFSTDPDDLQQRAGFSTSGAEQYVRKLADAYAAAGETQPIVMMSQQESNGNNTTPGDPEVLAALYNQATHDGMKTETLVEAASDATTFSAAPRAVAFPFIPGGKAIPSSIVNGQTVYPATIDYHDTQIGMSFLAGHTLPTRAFRYAEDPVSKFDVPLVSLPHGDFPTLEKAAATKEQLAVEIMAPIRLHFGIALWASPATLRINQPNVIPAGRAGEVVIFDLEPGENQIVIHCPGCSGTTLPYST
ncbi:MAG: hypothetical protein WAK16_12580 [Candidatus Cybelea sp.]